MSFEVVESEVVFTGVENERCSVAPKYGRGVLSSSVIALSVQCSGVVEGEKMPNEFLICIFFPVELAVINLDEPRATTANFPVRWVGLGSGGWMHKPHLTRLY